MVEAPGIEIEGLEFRIGEFAMRSLSLRIREGEYFVLTGPNGAGKSMLVKILAGLLRPEAGRIRIQGRDMLGVPPWRRNIGYVPQDGLLFPNYSVGRNIEYGLRVRHVARDRRREAVQEAAGLLGIGHLLERRVTGLSGGEQQRVALARALVLKPAVLLLDEPVSAIDEETRDALCEELKRIQGQVGVTTLHVSHNRRETELVADRVGVMEEGALREIREMG